LIQYDRALARLQEQLTKERAIEEALKVKGEREWTKTELASLQSSPSSQPQPFFRAPEPRVPVPVKPPLIRKPFALPANPKLRGRFKLPSRGLVVGLTFEDGISDGIKRPTITATETSVSLDGRFGKGCKLTQPSRIIIAPVKTEDKGSWCIWLKLSERDAQEMPVMHIIRAWRCSLAVREGWLRAMLPKGKRVGAQMIFDEWMHVAVTWDKTEARAYVNGDMRSSSTKSGAVLKEKHVPAKRKERLVVGARWQTGFESFVGNIDELLVYDRCLTEKEVAAIAAKALP